MACMAMRSRFELLLLGEQSEVFLRAAGEEAVEEIRALERQLNYFSPASEISSINRGAARGPVRVEPRLFGLLCECRRLWDETEGAFDPTIGPLFECWGFGAGGTQVPGKAELEEARSRTGMDKVELDEANRTVRFARDGVALNLGSIGKGYALDQAAAILREYGIRHALLHGGTSSVHAVGGLPGGGPFPVAVADPRESGRRLATAQLEDTCLGVSGNHLNTRVVGGRKVGHVIDPRSGLPVEGRMLAAVTAETAARADALSTALLCSGPEAPPWLTGWHATVDV